MYMPRLRARQHELLSIIRCSHTLATNARVIPIVEPVKEPNSVFVQRLKKVAEAGLRCDLVLNPSVGELQGPGMWSDLGQFYLSEGLLDFHNVAVLSNANADHQSMSAWVDRARIETREFSIDIVHEKDMSSTLQGGTYRQVRWNVAEDRTVPARFGLPLSGSPVVWAHDPFPSLPRNRDYLGQGTSVFSARVAGYRSAGYGGVSDFLTIGSSFVPGGGRAYAVAIHFTYLVGNEVHIRHFCSDSNDDVDNVAGKFFEALEKLIHFIDSNSIPSNLGIESFRDCYVSGHFPGLGKVKEHSMVNHMLVMDVAVQ